MFGRLFSVPLAPGTAAPEFSLPDADGNPVALSGFRGGNVILVFYPGDDTMVCRRQLCEFRDNWKEAEASNVRVLGINPQGARSHARFAEKYGFPFPLLVDKGRKVAALYHASGLIVRRTVYLIGPDGTIRYARRGKPPVAEVLAAARLRVPGDGSDC